MTTFLHSVFFALALAVIAPCQQPTVVFKGGTIFDAVTERARPLGQLWVSGNRIAGEYPAGTPIPDGAKVHDTTGKTLIPGMFDLHVHTGVGGSTMTAMVPVTGADNLRSQIHCGVTHVVDLHGDEETIFNLRDTSRKDPSMARLYTAGAAFTRPKGHATQFGIPANTVDTTEDIDARMAVLLPRKPDVIKAVVEHGKWGGLNAFPTLDEQLFDAIAAHAEEASVPLFSHVWSAPEALLATSHGANALAHGIYLGPVTEELIAAMQDNETSYIPTLSVVLASVHTLQKRSPYDQKLAHECVHPDIMAAVLDDGAPQSLMASPMVRLGRRQEKLYLNNLQKMHAAGIRIGTGTDAGNPVTLHGPSLLFELGRYVAAGLTPSQTLRAATLSSAEILRIDQDFGSLTKGKIADIVIVDGDPTKDIADLWKIASVYKAGKAVDRSKVRKQMIELAKPAVAMVPEQDGVPLLVDDFADANITSNWGGDWEPTTDAIAGGKSTGKVDIASEDGKHHLRVRGEIKPGFRWGQWSGAAVQWDPSAKKVVDASAFAGITLRVRASERGYTITCHRAAVKDYNFWTVTFKGTGKWTTLRIPFTQFKQIGFGKTLEWSAKDIKGLQIEARNTPMGGAKGPFTLDIGSVSLYR